MESLEGALSKNKALLGDNYEKLGATTGKGLFRRKVMLAYKGKEKGWEIVKLNLIQQLFRKIGFYKSTHLNRVFNYWNKHKIGIQNFDKPLEKRLTTLWQKTYPKKPIPAFAQYFSNNKEVSLDNVDLFLFGEQHTKASHRKFIGEVINHYYRPGDLILVESDSGEQIEQKDCDQLKFVNPGCEVKGWDLKKDQYQQTKPIVTLHKIENLCSAFSSNFIPESKEKIFKELDSFISEVDPLLSFFVPNSNDRSKTLKQAQETITALIRNGTIKSSAELEFAALELMLPKKIYEKAEKLKHKYSTAEDLKKMKEQVAERNTLLAKTIEENCRPGRRIFVVAGAAHLAQLKMPKNLQTNIDLVKTAIKKHNFVLATPSVVERKFKLTALNPDYVKIPNPF